MTYKKFSKARRFLQSMTNRTSRQLSGKNWEPADLTTAGNFETAKQYLVQEEYDLVIPRYYGVYRIRPP